MGIVAAAESRGEVVRREVGVSDMVDYYLCVKFNAYKNGWCVCGLESNAFLRDETKITFLGCDGFQTASLKELSIADGYDLKSIFHKLTFMGFELAGGSSFQDLANSV